ncbi:MAG: thiamine pyrophosphate-binding protein [Paracoccus sp. (in: a-proteobacteria)]|nr:thiamine pyrophosphate-binding protein [Paracoccus sp. (in: a-proteobacteria)]
MAHGGRILVDALKAHGVDRVFSVPGESYLAVLDGLYDSGIENIVCRHEGGASMMAEAHAKLTQAPGVCLVTRGPGATNASAGVHVAKHDQTPMILLVGQIARPDRDREAFQEVDYRAMFAPLAKWVAEIDQTDRIPEYIARAFHVARSGRPGPVVLSLPEDMLAAEVEATALPVPAPPPRGVSDAARDAVADAIRAAKKPLLIVGGTIWDQKAADDLARFASAWQLPVAAPFRRQDHFDNRLEVYAGDLGVGFNPALGRTLEEADLVVSFGSRLSDVLTRGYTSMDPRAPHSRVVMIHPGPEQAGVLWRSDPAIVADPRDMAAALADMAAPEDIEDWRGWTQKARAAYDEWRKPRETPGDVKMERVIGWLCDNLPDDAIITNGAGNYAAFLHRYYQWKRMGTQLAPTSGSMGYGLPASIAASLQHKDRVVVCLAGDGCMQMTLNEMSTARQYGAHPVVIVANNGTYGTIRMHQEREYPGRVSGTDMANPDFAALARAYGGHGETVERTEDFPDAFARARDAGRVAVIELRLDQEALTPGLTLSQIRKDAEKRG